MRRLEDSDWHSSVSASELEPGAMESPLDVLSRAASMVETSSRLHDSYTSSNGASSPRPAAADDKCRDDPRTSPGKELPTRMLKQERARDRQEVTSALAADREHMERLNNLKKCASTQTQFSSFMGEPAEPPPPPPYYTTHDTIPQDTIVSRHRHHLLSNHSYPHPPPPLHPYYSHTHTGATAAASDHSHPSLLLASNASRDSAPSSSSSSKSLSTSSPSSSPASYLPPPPPSHPDHAPSYSSSTSHHLRHPHTSPSPPAGATPTLPPAPPLVHAPLRSTPPPPPLPPYPGPPLPPPHYHADISRSGVDVQNAPLNLSLSNTATPSQPISGARQSPPTNKKTSKVLPSYQRRSSLDRGFGSPMSQEDESIEEHFRRSLGKSYPEPSAPVPESPPPPPPVENSPIPRPEDPSGKDLSQTAGEKICSVDDHFARALGDQMWTEIKARTEVPSLDGLTDTVDAHFAKALGANMWKKLKAENKMVEDVSIHKKKQQQKPGLAHNGSTAAATLDSAVQAPMVI